ncbi:Crp/Fnr family transcriptional regulator [Brevundimonas lutea]|uniref:Crp/Fnr family transcriptional regulator n=1 Tax=Brevundimonas lutea TaxID=2293980 RepID=UPI0013CE6A00|nr:helix-turn-helix domain-containing protein [Brevundimonas lutea]
MVGREGLTGLAPFLAGAASTWEVVVRASGDALVAAPIRRALSRDRLTIKARQLELTDLYQAQAAQAGACKALHQAPQRLARWLLTADDLSDDGRVNFTQEELARLLGVQRSTVSELAHRLKALKLSPYSRGAIRIHDRVGLERQTCECYAMLRAKVASVGLTRA